MAKIATSDRKFSMCIYVITNILSGKKYIGQTKNLVEKRWKRHISHSKSAINSAMVKYGVENFLFEVIDIAESMEQLNHKEVLYIDMYKTMSPNGYNLDSGGKNKIPSEETRLKMSSRTREKSSTETIEKRRLGLLEYYKSEEGIEHKLKNRVRASNFRHSSDTKIKMSKIAIEVGQRPEVRTGRSMNNIGKTYSKETCEKISNSKTGVKIKRQKASNKSGEIGIMFRIKEDQKEGAWSAQVYNNDIKKLCSASFGVRKFGYDEAHNLARAWRLNKLEELKGHKT